MYNPIEGVSDMSKTPYRQNYLHHSRLTTFRCGVDWVTANAGTIDVANMSLGGTGSEEGCNDGALQEAICNFGADIDLIAPGVCILSTWKSGGYNTISGTSMASPHVAGAAALYLSSNPNATPGQVKTALQNAGNLNWNDVDDLDNTKEKLVDVDSF
jgi:subtilisin family serine protease